MMMALSRPQAQAPSLASLPETMLRIRHHQAPREVMVYLVFRPCQVRAVYSGQTITAGLVSLAIATVVMECRQEQHQATSPGSLLETTPLLLRMHLAEVVYSA